MKALHIIEHICAVLMALGVPSIINGFLSHKSEAEQTVGGIVLDAVSALARKDSPSTFKLPGTLSKTPPCEAEAPSDI